mgnify:CR=1 FL=1
MRKGAYVSNVADERQVGEAKSRESIRRKRELDDLRAILATKVGRRVCWRLLKQCKTFDSISSQSSQIYYNAGKQDVGHFLLNEIKEANEERLYDMMREDKEFNIEDVVERIGDDNDE